ncbi:MAG: YdeI/OmpD-associated family protein [Chloroflexota bacterium]
MRFRTTILGAGKTAAGIQIPTDILDALGTSRKPAVTVTIKGYTYRSTVATISGAFMIGVSNAVRTAAGVAAGDEIDVEIELDTQPREVTVPPDLAAALDADPAAKRFFETLSYSNKRRVVEPIDGAKAPETRQRRLDKSIERLREGKL